jgi:hypothetical protein
MRPWYSVHVGSFLWLSAPPHRNAEQMKQSNDTTQNGRSAPSATRRGIGAARRGAAKQGQQQNLHKSIDGTKPKLFRGLGSQI